MITFYNLGKKGKLGNQMFQYATLMALALENNYSFGISFDKNRGYILKGDNKKHYLYLNESFNLTCENITDFSFIKHIYKEDINFKFDKNIFKIKDNTNIDGYFQSEKYFKKYRQEILKEFTFKDDIIKTSEEKLNIYENNIKISIHIRRGDYLKFEKWHPPVSSTYLKSSIQYIKEKMNDIPHVFLIFTDDAKWAKEKFEDIQVIEGNDKYVDLCMMSMCEHNIIANSSFSWWAAWLNKNKDKIILAPEVWFGSKVDKNKDKNIIPKSWKKIKC